VPNTKKIREGKGAPGSIARALSNSAMAASYCPYLFLKNLPAHRITEFRHSRTFLTRKRNHDKILFLLGLQMQQPAASIIFAFCLACSAVGEAAYVIKLRNGNEFITGRYWNEGTQVMFDVYGGVFGIDRAFVTKIEASNRALKPEVAIYEDVKNRPQIEQAKEAKETKKPTTPSEATAEPVRKDDPITQEFNRLQETSRGIGGMLTSEIRDLLRDITAFKNKISRDSKLFIKYASEFNEAQELGAATETALRSRDQ
jgi:hypothetical protein